MRTRTGRIFPGVRLTFALAAAAALVSPADSQAQSNEQHINRELEALRTEVEELRRRDEENRGLIESLSRRLEELDARTSAAAATTTVAAPTGGSGSEPMEDPDAALDAALADLDTEQPTDGAGQAATSKIWSRSIGNTDLRLIDISMDVMFAAGGSTVDDDELGLLQGGAHDPDRNGFTLQQAELSFMGAVDPYFTGEAHIVATANEIELEEAFGTTTALPWGLQLEGGFFFTEFGRINPRHPHQWDWLDQPVVNTRMFGGEGLRSSGVRLSWLMPTSWPSELHLGIQNSGQGEFTRSFLSNEPVGGRPEFDRGVDGPADLLYLARWANGWDLSPTTTSVLGLSGLFGPNSAGEDTRTWVAGLDFLLRWRPTNSFRGWPFVSWQTELMYRAYETEMVTTAEDPDLNEDLPTETLRDWGLYTQTMWGFRPQWEAGLRIEYASGRGDSVDDGDLVTREIDPDRDDRIRLSPLLVYWPSHFSRLRLQYNYDRARHLDGDNAHTVWLGAEIFYGAHPAHSF
jgi:hypothetical protein